MTSTQHLLDNYDPVGVDRALAKELRTSFAIFFHTVRDRELAMTTAHQVSSDANGTPVVGPGRPLTPEDEQRVLDLLIGSTGQSTIEILPSVVLHRDKHAVMWWLPPSVRPMHLLDHKSGVRTIQTRWPSLVALVRDRELYLVAVEGDQRPTGDSPIFHAPMPNVYRTTLVCTGNAKLPLSAHIADLPGWESVVYDTAFTTTHHDGTLRPQPAKKTKAGAKGKSKPPAKRAANVDFWRARAGETQPFPDTSLNPIGLTIAAWIPAVMGIGRNNRGEG